MRRALALSTALLLLALAPGPARGAEPAAVDLSPASWPAGELEAYADLNFRSGRAKPRAVSESGMVVGTSGALAVRAGVEALRQGGSAMDAALVTSLTQITLAAGSWVSYAGIVSLVVYDADTRKVSYLNGEFATLLEEDDPLSIPAQEPSGRTALVPGFMAAVQAAHDRHGELPFAQLFEPAIYFAEEGFRVNPDLAGTMEFRRGVLHRRPETRAIFFKPDGSLYGVGETFRQPALAETLRQVARHGGSYMYDGPWGERLVAALRGEGGKMTLEDLRRYRAQWRKPKKGRFRGLVVHGPRWPAAGGTLAAKAFKSLKRVDLAGRGHYTESPDSLFHLIKATRDVYRFVPPLGHSDGVVTVDAEGNVVAVLHSINTNAWGLTGIFVDGVSIPDPAANQQRRIRDAGPGKRIWTGGNPLIATLKRRPVVASSAIGRGLFESTMLGLVNVIEHGMDPHEAIDTVVFRAPQRLPEGGIGATLVTRGDFAPDLLDAVRDRGIPIQERSPIDFESRGYWIGVRLDPDTGELVGATARLFNGWVEGVD